ncbi:MAG TPA: hypothetical protein VHB20_19295 [Verrucomicrobiae bacterium]|jgi:hypothetical protein|nr:hypothetical protein [Verrucomicrobiae bacterium]
MSDNWLILIPKSPSYVPSLEAQDRAVALVKTIAPESDEVKAEVSKYPRLIDCGANLEKITCPNCHVELRVDWWADWVSKEEELNFPLKPTQLPCCGTTQCLADLFYDWPQGFARFSLEAMNPNIPDLPPGADLGFENMLGCSLLKIWQHL